MDRSLRAAVRSVRRAVGAWSPRDQAFARDLLFSYLLCNVSGIFPDQVGGNPFERLSTLLGVEFEIVRRARGAELRHPAYGVISGIHVEPLHDVMEIGDAYQEWNRDDRDRATWGVSRRGETDGGTSAGEIARATQIYSPPYMTRFLLEEAFLAWERSRSEGDSALTIFDPACGSGHFLVQAVRLSASRQRCFPHIEQLSAERIYGADIDPFAVELTRALLTVELQSLNNRVPAFETYATLLRTIVHVTEPIGSLDRSSLSPVLRRSYGIIATNPPYLGRRKLSSELRTYLDTEYPAAKHDLCAAFVIRCIELLAPGGALALVMADKWLRLKGYQTFRTGAFDFRGVYGELSLSVVAELGQRAFDAQAGLHDGVGVVLICGTKLEPGVDHTVRVFDCTSLRDVDSKILFLSNNARDESEYGRSILQSELRDPSKSQVMLRVPGIPRNVVLSKRCVADSASVVVGLQTNDDRRYVRFVWEVDPSSPDWTVHQVGGFARWYGSNYRVLDTRLFHERGVRNSIEQWCNQEGWTYAWFANGRLSLRRKEAGWSFGRAAASGVFTDDVRVAGFLNSRLASHIAQRLSGKVQLPEGVVRRIPLPDRLDLIDPRLVEVAVSLKKRIVQADPLDATFARPDATLLDLLRDEVFLLVIEAALDNQSLDAVGASVADRRALESATYLPVVFRSLLTTNDRESFSSRGESLPHWFDDALDMSRYSCSSEPPECDTIATGKCLRPDSGFIEILSDTRGIHPIAAYNLLAERSSPERSSIVALHVKRRALVVALLSLGYSWRQSRCIDPWTFDVAESISCEELERRTIESLEGEGVLADEIERSLQRSLLDWLRIECLSWHEKLFKGSPLLVCERTGRMLHFRLRSECLRGAWATDLTRRIQVASL